MKILSNNEKQDISKKLREQFGIREIPGLLIKKEPESLFLFQGDFTPDEITKIKGLLRLERIGIYFAKMQGNEFRLGIEATQILKEQISKNIFELSDKQIEQWMSGQELNIKTGKKGFLIMKYRDDFLGTGKASENKIGNSIPKIRRLKKHIN